MCGRIALTLPHEAMASLFQASPANDLPAVPQFNLCPTQSLAAVALSPGGTRQYRAFRWGFVPHWAKSLRDGPLLINARSETVAEKPAFRAAIRARRALVPVTGFYEWDRADPKTPLPWFVSRADGRPLVLGGLWQDWAVPDSPETISTLAIVTTGPNADIAAIHDRLPVVVEEADWPLWLGEAGHGAARLMQPAPEGVLRLWRVGTAVNSNRAQGPELPEPLATDPGSSAVE